MRVVTMEPFMDQVAIGIELSTTSDVRPPIGRRHLQGISRGRAGRKKDVSAVLATIHDFPEDQP